MASSDQPSEAKELLLLDKVELRIALAEGDQKLQSTLKTYLAPLLLKLASPHPAVRNKVISICSHINTRIQPDTIKLPVQALVEQFRAQSNVPLIRHFDLLYIHKGVPRLSAVEKNELFPAIVKGIAASGRTTPEHASQVMNLVFQLIEYFKFPSRGTEQDAQLRSKLEVSDEDTDYLASWFGKLLLFVPARKSPGQKPVCPGLTPEEYSFLALQDKADTWMPGNNTGLNLTQTKIRAARLLASGVFNDKERLFPALFATADPASAISDAGEDMLKRTLPNTDLEDVVLVRKLFTYFFGTEGPSGRQQARAPLRLKILGLLSKSVASTTCTTEIMKMVDEGLSSSNSDNGGPDAMQIDQPAFAAVQQISSQLSQTNGKSSGGLELSKFRTALFSYINFVARQGKQEALGEIAPRVLVRLRDFVEEQGWPRAASATSQQELESRAYAYEVIGLLAKAGPDSLVCEPNLEILRWLFKSLAYDRSSNSLTVSIEEALSTVLTAFSRKPLDGNTQDALEQLLLAQMQESTNAVSDPDSERRSTRYVAVRYANRCLPFSSVRGRGVDLLAVGAGLHDRPEVIEEGHRGLSPYWYRMLNGSLSETESITFPKFADVMHFIFCELSYGGQTVSDELPQMELVQHLRDHHVHVFADAILFARLVLLQEILSAESNGTVTTDSEWEQKLNSSIDNDMEVREKVKSGLSKRFDGSTELLLNAFASALTAKNPLPPSSSSAEAPSMFVDMCSLLPDQLVGRLAPQYQLLIPHILSNYHRLRTTSARAFGVLATHPEVQYQGISAHLQGLMERVSPYKTAIGAPANQVHGATLALAYYYSRHTLRRGSSPLAHDWLLKTYFETINSMLGDVDDKEMKKAAFGAIGELCLYQVVVPASFGEVDALKRTIDRIADFAKTGDEQAAVALGHMATILTEPDDMSLFESPTRTGDDNPATMTEVTALLPHIYSRLYALHDIRTAESHFSIGAAISVLCVSWSSSYLSTAIDVPHDPPASPPRTKVLPTVLALILKASTTTKPSLRKASTIWLLCLVQYAGHLPALQSALPQCQSAFIARLADRDELVQETASRGLGLVYSKGTATLRADLVRNLMASLSPDASTSRGGGGAGTLSGSVGEDTQLFAPGALPTGAGESVSTYRDIMNLASEIGDGSLVYRFMGLAASNAVWSSRAALGRFGLGDVLAGATGDAYLRDNPRVVVALYRYRFDPNEGVRRSMAAIWNAVVNRDGSAAAARTVDEHLDAIVEDLLKNLFGREWRTRQACCAALQDLVQGREVARWRAHAERIWAGCFRVLDDIKESVRVAAAGLARTLTGILTRTLEAAGGGGAGTSSSATAAAGMLKHVLPFLLGPGGLEAGAKEVQAFAVASLLDIVKKASAGSLRPFIPEIVERSLGLIGAMEHEAVEYVRLNAKKYEVSERKIDDMRLSSVRQSPVMEAVERCLDLTDDATMAELQPRIVAAMRSAIALPSKVACGRVLVSLATRHGFVFKPYADGFLRVLEKVVVDRNDTVASSYAAAAGYVARAASDAQILRLVGFAEKLYFDDSEGDRDAASPRNAITSGDVVRAVSKHATDRFNSLASGILPFVFVAKNDGHETVKRPFKETWDEHVGGSRTVSLYLSEIMGLASRHLESPRWAIKHAAARAVAEAVTSVAGLGIDEAAGKVVWPPLEKALAAKTWEGKEVVLEAFVRFAETGDRFWSGRDEVKTAMTKIAVREAKRQKAAYRKHSIPSLGKVALALAQKDVDMSDAVFEVVDGLVDELAGKLGGDPEAMDIDDGRGAGTSDLDEAILRGCVRALTDSTTCAAEGAHKKDLEPPPMMRDREEERVRRALQRVADIRDLLTEKGKVRLGPETERVVRESAVRLLSSSSSSSSSPMVDGEVPERESSGLAALRRRLLPDDG